MDNVQLRNKIFFPKGSLEADTEPGTGQMNCGGSKVLSYHHHSSQIFSIIWWGEMAESRRNGDWEHAASTAASNLQVWGRQK